RLEEVAVLLLLQALLIRALRVAGGLARDGLGDVDVVLAPGASGEEQRGGDAGSSHSGFVALVALDLEVVVVRGRLGSSGSRLGGGRRPAPRRRRRPAGGGPGAPPRPPSARPVRP